jgi:hypothetical protein
VSKAVRESSVYPFDTCDLRLTLSWLWEGGVEIVGDLLEDRSWHLLAGLIQKKDLNLPFSHWETLSFGLSVWPVCTVSNQLSQMRLRCPPMRSDRKLQPDPAPYLIDHTYRIFCSVTSLTVLLIYFPLAMEFQGRANTEGKSTGATHINHLGSRIFVGNPSDLVLDVEYTLDRLRRSRKFMSTKLGL